MHRSRAMAVNLVFCVVFLASASTLADVSPAFDAHRWAEEHSIAPDPAALNAIQRGAKHAAFRGEGAIDLRNRDIELSLGPDLRGDSPGRPRDARSILGPRNRTATDVRIDWGPALRVTTRSAQARSAECAAVSAVLSSRKRL